MEHQPYFKFFSQHKHIHGLSQQLQMTCHLIQFFSFVREKPTEKTGYNFYTFSSYFWLVPQRLFIITKGIVHTEIEILLATVSLRHFFLILSASKKLRKVNFSFIISVCPSAATVICEYFSTISREISRFITILQE
jgi:hypothetical protein